ncbi:Uncharacterised protein [uncultured Blautia sp.]|nr:Uncharacterised protein [uncultured Blautia sp.]
MALCAPPQAENPASRILFYVIGKMEGGFYGKEDAAL